MPIPVCDACFALSSTPSIVKEEPPEIVKSPCWVTPRPACVEPEVSVFSMVTSAPSVISTSEPSAITRPPVVSLMVSEPPAGLSVSSVSVSAVSVFSTPPLMVSLVFAPSLASELSLAPSPPTRMPSILTLSLEISCPPPSVTLLIASEPSIVLSPLRVISTSELSRALMPAVAFSVRLILVLSSVRSTLVFLLSSSSFRFTPISMPLPPVVRLESLTVRSHLRPRPP